LTSGVDRRRFCPNSSLREIEKMLMDVQYIPLFYPFKIDMARASISNKINAAKRHISTSQGTSFHSHFLIYP